jgi:hypothetical protein
MVNSAPELTSTPRHLQSRNNQLNMQVSTPQTPRSLRSQNSHGDCGGDPVPQTPRITQSRCSQRSRTSTPQSRSNHTEYVQASTPQAPRSLRSENSREDCGRGSVSKTPRTAESRCSQRRRTSTPLTPTASMQPEESCCGFHSSVITLKIRMQKPANS